MTFIYSKIIKKNECYPEKALIVDSVNTLRYRIQRGGYGIVGGGCITASRNILASGNISLKRLMAPLETI